MINSSMRHSNFRQDINGLRAIAVLAVIFYHFGITGFGGGFVGVDIFFVISGYLMTGIVISALERDVFSIADFYIARAKRIVPALIVLCAALLLLGWWILLPTDYKEMGDHVLFSLLFLSNIKFWDEAGYFDVASHEKWLLHTWSLSVEWQFYLLLPLLLVLIWRWRPGRNSIAVPMVLALLLSFFASVILTPRYSTAVFYLLPTRAWEMLAGGVVFLLADHVRFTNRHRQVMEAIGFVLVISAIIGFDASSQWPGWRAAVPVFGTVAILMAARKDSIFTSNFWMQWVGTRSYSLYLWHWPFVVIITYLSLQDNSKAIIAGLALTLVVGFLSYKFVELPARVLLGRLRRPMAGLILMTLAALVAATSMLVSSADGVKGRFPLNIEIVSQEATNRSPRRDECHQKTGVASPSCMFGGSDLRAIVLGDSHADSVISAIVAAAPALNYGVMQWSYSGCPTLQGVRSIKADGRQCGDFVDWTMQKLKTVPSDVPIVIVNRHGQYAFGTDYTSNTYGHTILLSNSAEVSEAIFLKKYAENIVKTACELAKNHNVYLVRPIPEMRFHVPKTMARSMMIGSPIKLSVSIEDYNNRNELFWKAQNVAQEICGVKILNPLPYLCDSMSCAGSINGMPIYYDDNHLSEFGNKLLVPMFKEVFEKTRNLP